MKTKAQWFLRLIKILTDIAWFGNIGFIFVILVVMSMNFFSNSYSNYDVTVKYPLNTVKEIFQPISDNAKDITIEPAEAQLKMQIKNTFPYIAGRYLIFAVFEILIMIIIFNLRKFFTSLKHSMPFNYRNVNRMKIVALCFALLVPVNILKGLFDHFVLLNNVSGYKETFWLVWSESFMCLVIGGIIYIMADVFRYGFDLKKENEGFV